MIDIKSKLVLKILIKECSNGSYKIIEASDIINSLPPRYRVDSEGLDNILNFLERQDYISIKYDDDGVYCLCVLPGGFEASETDNKKEKPRKKQGFPILIFLCLLFSFIGGFLGAYLASII